MTFFIEDSAGFVIDNNVVMYKEGQAKDYRYTEMGCDDGVYSSDRITEGQVM